MSAAAICGAFCGRCTWPVALLAAHVWVEWCSVSARCRPPRRSLSRAPIGTGSGELRREPVSCALPSQDDDFTESYISTIGVDFVRACHAAQCSHTRPRAPRLVFCVRVLQRFRTVKIEDKTVKLQIVGVCCPLDRARVAPVVCVTKLALA